MTEEVGAAPPANNPEPATPATELANTPSIESATTDGDVQPGEGQAAPEEEFEEVEREGKKARIPKWLKPELLMQSDYTRKTQEVAEQRKQAEAAAAAVQAERQAWQAYRQEAGQYYALQARIEPYAKITPEQWQKWGLDQPAEAANAWRDYQMLEKQHRDIGTRLAQKDAETQSATERSFVQRYEQVTAKMAQLVPTWNAEASKVGQYLTEQGFDQPSVKLIASHLGATQMARKAYLYDQLMTKHRAAATPAPAPVATPAPVGGQRTATTDLRALASRKDISAFVESRNKATRRPAAR